MVRWNDEEPDDVPIGIIGNSSYPLPCFAVDGGVPDQGAVYCFAGINERSIGSPPTHLHPASSWPPRPTRTRRSHFRKTCST